MTDQGSLHYLLGLNLPIDYHDTAEGQESIKAKLNAIRNKLERQVSTLTWQCRLKLIFHPLEGVLAFDDLWSFERKNWDQYNSAVWFICLCVCSSHSLAFFPQGPCHIELHTALETITLSQQKLGEKFTTFYLPNCDNHGYYKAKQVSI